MSTDSENDIPSRFLAKITEIFLLPLMVELERYYSFLQELRS